MPNKREKVERITVDPFILDFSDSTKSFSATDREDSPIADPLSPPAATGVEVENYLKQAFLFLIRGDWPSAEEYCDKELRINPDSADAYLGKLMAELHVSKEEHLSEFAAPFDQSENYVGIRRSGNREVIARVDGYLRQIVERQKECLYTEAKRIMDSAKQKEDYQRAEALFGKITSYKDASKRQKECQKILENWGKPDNPINWKKITICTVIALAVAVIAGIVFGGIQWYRSHKESSGKTETTTAMEDMETDTTEPTTEPSTTTTKPAETTTELTIIASGICGASPNQSSVTWTLDNKGKLTISGQGKMAQYMEANLYLPTPWKDNEDKIQSVVVQSGIKNVSAAAFDYCEKLTDVVLETGLVKIEQEAFSHCASLKSISIPSSVIEIESLAFDACDSLGKIDLQQGLQVIGSMAFQNCHTIKEIIIPQSVEKIGIQAFDRCEALKTIDFPDKQIDLGADVFNHTAWYNAQQSGCVYLGKVLYCYKTVDSERKTIDEQVTVQDGTLAIADQAFINCDNLTKIYFPNSLRQIGANAFSDCKSLSELKLPDGLISIGHGAFLRCSSLYHITIPASVQIIEDFAIPDETVIYGEKDSYAEKWARKNNIGFIPSFNDEDSDWGDW